MSFDVAAAKRAGYSDSDIANYLAQQQKFDIAGARKAGHSDGDIIDHLQAQRAPAYLKRESYQGETTKAVARQAEANKRPVAAPKVGDEQHGRQWDRLDGSISAPAPVKPTVGAMVEGGRANFAAMNQGVQQAISDAAGKPSWQTDSQRAASQASTMRETERSQQAVEAARPQFESHLASGLWGVGESLIQNAPGVVGSIITANPVPGLAWAGASTSSSAYGKYRARGATPGEAALGAGGEGAIEVATELLPTHHFLDALYAPEGKAFLKEAMKGIAADVPGEQLATLGQDALDTAIANPGATWAQYWAQRPDAALETLITTVGQGGVMVGGGSAVNYGLHRANEAAARKRAAARSIAGDAVNAFSPPAGIGAGIGAGIDNGGGIAGLVRVPADGVRSKAARAVSVSAGDIASPIDTDLIAQGKSQVADAQASHEASKILGGAGVPAVGKRVQVAMPGGINHTGTIADAFDTDGVPGVTIALDNGTTLSEHLPTLADTGVQIRELAAQPQPAPKTQKPGKGGGINAGIFNGLVARGLPEHIARGAAAGVHAEAGSNHNALNPTSGAMGLGQWLGPRKAELIRRYGANPTLDQQLDFLAWELKGGDAGGKAVLAAKDEAGALDAYIRKFMRPAAGAETDGDLKRGRAALGLPMSEGAPGAIPDVSKDGADAPIHTDLQFSDSSYLHNQHIEEQAAQVAEPTDAQKEAGNYKKGHISLHGLDITIETPRGAERSGTAPDGSRWSVRMPDHYGYVKRSKGADGEQVDVYVGPKPESRTVYVVDQNDADTGKFDEHKAMLGYDSIEAAANAYHAAFDDGRGSDRMGAVTEMSVDEFRSWLQQEQTAPASEGPPQTASDPRKADEAGTGAQAPASGDLEAQARDLAIQAIQDRNDTAGFNNAGTWSFGQKISPMQPGNHMTPGKAHVELRNAPGRIFTFSDRELRNEAAKRPDGYARALEVVRAGKVGSASLIQRHLQIGLGEANELLRRMQAEGHLGEFNARTGQYPVKDDTGSTATASTAPTVEDFTDKSVIVRGLDKSDASKAKIAAALPEKALPLWNDKAGGWVVSKKHADKLHAHLAGEQAGDGTTPEPQSSAENTPSPPSQSTAPEHAAVGVDDRELSEIVAQFNHYQQGMFEGGDDQVTHVFDAPKKGEVVRLADKVKVYHAEHGWMTRDEAKSQIAQWKEHARAQGDRPATNGNRIVLSLFDLTGQWSKPWAEAGYQVYRFDIQDDAEMGDVNNFSTEFFTEWFGDFEGQDVYAILAACPCTDFASSGARHFAAKDADGRTVASVKLVHQALAAIEYFKPAVWAIENPVGRIEKLGGLPPWRLSFDPNHLGDPYTKKTLLWGRFNGELPIAPVEPTEGSKMHRLYGGKSLATKNARSETPEGFAYGFFMANNAVDHPVMAVHGKFDRLDRDLIAKALKTGVSEEDIGYAAMDYYYDSMDDDAANAAIRELIPEPPTGGKADTVRSQADLSHAVPNSRTDQEAKPAENRASQGAEGADAGNGSNKSAGGQRDARKALVRYASGMSRIGDLTAGAHALGGSDKMGVGVDVGELTKPAIERIAHAIVDWKAKVFVDSGAFSLFKRNLKNIDQADKALGDLFERDSAPKPDLKAMDFGAVMDRYDSIMDAVGEYDAAEEVEPGAVMFVMPDVVGDQAASLDLVSQYKNWISTQVSSTTMLPIVPIQKGELSLAEAYRKVADTLGRDDFIVGVPSNEAAVTTEELRSFVEDAKPRKLHFLGAVSEKKLGPKMDALQGVLDANESYALDHLSADANILRSALYSRPVPPGGRGDAVRDTLRDRDLATGSRNAAYGTANKVFTNDAAEKARALLRSKLNQLNSGMDPEVAQAGLTLMGYHIEAGARAFMDAARAVATDLGVTPADLRRSLRSWYMSARMWMEDHGHDVRGMDDDAAVKVDLSRIEQWGAAPVETSNPTDGNKESENDDAGHAVHQNGAGSLAGLPADDVSRPQGKRDAERAGAAGEPGGRAAGRPVDGSRDAEEGGRGNGAARPDPAAAGTGSRVSQGAKPARSKPATAISLNPVEAAEQAHIDPSGAIEKASPNNVPAVDFAIDDSLALGQGTESAKYQDNVEAIRTLKKIEAENRRASPAEQRVLARYVGWGGLKNAFRVAGAREGEGIAKGWEKRVAELEELLTPAELKAARNSTTAAHYTSQTVVQAMWKAVARLGFTGGAVLEPSVGTGNFLGLMPRPLHARSHVFAVEYDSLTARMAQMLYPNAAIVHAGFQEIPLPANQFALAIGNPPFGRESLHFPHNAALNGKSIHNQFFLGSLDGVAEGGIMAMVVSHNLMDALDASNRYDMAAKAEFLGGIRLPDTAFKENARTEVVTDMLFFRKRTAAQAEAAAAAVEELRTGKTSREAPAGTIDAKREIAAWVKSEAIPDPAGSGEQINANGYFMRNPHMVIGSINATGTMNARADLNVTLDDPSQFSPMLDRAVARLPEGRAAPDLEARTTAHFKVMAEAMRLAATRAEMGAVKVDTDGNLKMVVDLDGGDLGKSVKREIVLTENTPFTDDYSLSIDGKWQRTTDKIGPDGKPAKVMKDGRATNRNEKETITYAREADIPAKDRWGKDRIAALRAMLPVRDAMKQQLVLESQGATAAMIDLNRKRLNKAYDAFAKAHGKLHDAKNAKIAMLMPDGALALAAERNAGTDKAPRIVKADIMDKRVVMPPQVAEKAEDAGEAIAIVLSESGRIDLDRVAALLGTDEAGAAKALGAGEAPAAFFDPELDRWEPRDLYLSGMVRRKLNMAREANLDANVKALEEVLPPDWTIDQITPILGSAWIPGQVYADFLRHLGYHTAHVSYSDVTNAFTVMFDGKPEAQWMTSGRAHNPGVIVSRMLNSQGLKVQTKDVDGKVHTDEEGTAESEAKGAELFNEFQSWAFSDDQRAQELAALFNEKYNTRLIRQRDGSHLRLYGKVPDAIIKMRRHQMNAIWRGITDRAVLYDHVVGAGKTFTAIARVMERRRMGLSRKPMIVVPNHLVGQWAKDVKALYPGANVMAAGKADFERKNRRRLFARIASSDFDMVIIGHSSFGFIDLDRATEERYINEELTAAQAAIAEAQEEAAKANMGGWRKPFGVAEAERLVKKLETRLEKLRSGNRDRLLTFEEMGIDDLTIDEAHEFKNLAYSSRLQNVSGMGNKTGSQKAMDLHLKVRSLSDRPGTSLAFLTGTPVSNSVAELYLILRNLAPNEMREMGIENFDAWRSMFVSVGTEWEPTEAGGVKEVNRLGREWNNMRALMDLYYSVADAVPMDDIRSAFAEDNPGKKFPVPDVVSARREGHDREAFVVEPDDVTADMLNEIVDDYRALPSISDPKERNVKRLKLMDRARKVSLDPRAVDPRNPAPSNGGKIAATVGRVASIYRKWEADKGTQIIFLDRSVPKAKGDDKIVEAYDALRAKLSQAIRENDEKAEAKALDDLEKYNPDEIESLRAALEGGWNAYDEIKRQLVAKGIPADEVRFVQEANTDQQKRELFDLVKTGKVRVLIGSTPRMGAGTNVQDRLVALHHVDVTWKPSDIEQREGRIVRQGNKLLDQYGDDFAVEVIAYTTARTVDAKMWSLNATKLKAINGIRKYDGSFHMEFEDEESASMAEMAALATGDPMMIERVILDSSIKKLERDQRSFTNRRNAMTAKLKQNERTVAAAPGRIDMYEGFAKEAAAAVARGKEAYAGRSIDVEGKTYHDRDEAEAATKRAIAEIRGEDDKARYSITVAGEKVTTQDQIADAMNKAFGTEDFTGTLDGKTITRINDLAKAITNKGVAAGKDKREFTVDGITINGLPTEIDVADGLSKKFSKTVTLSLLDAKGRTAGQITTMADGLSTSVARNLVEKAQRALDPDRFMELAAIEKRAVERAESEREGLEREAAKPWPQEGELEDKRVRLKDVIATLAEKEKKDGKVAEGRDEFVTAAEVAEDGGDPYNADDEQDPTSEAGPDGRRDSDVPVRGREGELPVRERPKLRGLGIAATFAREKATALVGHFVTHTSELADLAQIYRDPRHETLRVFFVKGAKIIHATAASTRSAGSAPLLAQTSGNDFAAWVKEQMASSGADGFYLLHNHPTGDPTPSPEDKDITSRVAREATGFKGHVVINSNRYATISAKGEAEVFHLPAYIADKLLTPSVPHEMLGSVINNTAKLATLAKGAQAQADKHFSLVIVGPKYNVRAIVDVPRSMLDRPNLIVMGTLRRYLRMAGGDRVFLIGQRQDLDNPAMKEAYAQGILLDGVDDLGRTMSSINPPRDSQDLPDFLAAGPANAVAENRAAFDDAETEDRFQKAKEGIGTTRSLRERVSEYLARAWHGITRHWISLPNEARYAELQQKLRAIEAAPQAAREQTIRLLDEMVKDFTDEDLDLFTRKVILDDLMWEAGQDHELPFGFTPTTLVAAKRKIDALVTQKGNPKVWNAVMRRKLLNRQVAQQLVDAGVLEAEQIKNPAYYRHQVLEYARAQMKMAHSPGKKLKTPKWAKRMGSSLDINANLLEAEFDWLNKALVDVPVAKTIEWIKRSPHNILDGLKKQATDSNKAGIAAKLEWAKDVLKNPADHGEDDALRAAALIEQEKKFRQNIAHGFQIVRTALEDDAFDVPRQHARAAAAIVNGTGSTDSAPFGLLSWMLDNDVDGAMGAAMILKAIGQRRAWTKALLGRSYVNPDDAEELTKRLAPEGYRTWQPDEGKLLFTVKTIPEHVMDAMLERLEAPEGVSADELRAVIEKSRDALALGGSRYTMILPEEVADTLNQLRRPEVSDMYDHLVREPMRWWKRWVLVNPRRVIKYNINNLSGDLDAVLAGNPRLLRRVPEAAKELAAVMRGKAKPSRRYEQAVARGVFDSGLSVQEIPDLHKLEPFEKFAKKPGPLNKVTMIPLRKAWAALQGATQWRENVFRYAAYLDYADRLESGESQASVGYGASMRKMVDAIPDKQDRAALLARDLLGDYGAISHYGANLRESVMPFFSWMEINTKRYWRLTANAFGEGLGTGIRTGGGLALANGARVTAWGVVRMAMLYGLISLWNHLLWGDEEDELDEQQRQQLHVILGRNDSGEVITLRLQGAMSDALGWLGLGDAADALHEYELGRGSIADVAAAPFKAAANKVGTSLSPLITVPVEAATGKKIWPDIFNTRPNRDPWRNLMSTFSLDNEYDWAMDKPTRGYGRSWQESVIYRRDPGELAYNAAKGYAYDWLRREKGQDFAGGFTSARAEAARDYRTARKFGDVDAAEKALGEMASMGVTNRDFAGMVKRAAPLGPIPKKDRRAFVNQLTDEEYKTLQRAQAWYEKTFLAR